MPKIGALKSCLGLFAAGALTFVSMPAGGAQTYDGPAYSQDNEVIIIAPRRHYERGQNGGPIETVSLSRTVRYDDLDLRTDGGANRLYQRISRAAHDACDELDQIQPVSASDSPPCYADAMHFGQRDADDVIADARR